MVVQMCNLLWKWHPTGTKTNFTKAIRQEFVFVSTSHTHAYAFLGWLENSGSSDEPVVQPTSKYLIDYDFTMYMIDKASGI